ncbi:PREDICTED: protein RETICULATA-RELATED 6, chloroplastic-like [Camelina sativa]|uniref:Protein RETICULATA-RELATED 6, chloroplastic-like n=1 Tax=Camelina sativa TaxID=90675 RepID=A0ABM0ZII5_CAMSA|nr:PREDICTED: protein RETICULATA-RELATED 6, chloroplastic-like [Camelina sativa]XP_010516217.1 PREDICTED: protein RETICULATA-RELATED 6, chloroplastic-like [Camelina sativa]
MKLTATNDLFVSQPLLFHCPCSSSSSLPRRRRFHGFHFPINLANEKNNSVSVVALSDSDLLPSRAAFSRRAVLLSPLLASAASLILKPSVSLASEESSSATVTSSPAESPAPPPSPPPPASVNKEETITSRIYDATAIGEPMAMGKDKKKVWEKLMNARVVYLGEAEQVPTKDDKELELEIVRNLKKRCVESERQISVALEAFPLDLQDQLNQYMDKRMDGETLKSYVTHWPPQRWQEYEPLLSYCRDNSVKLIACGTPLKVLRTVQAEGIRGLSKAERKLYTPPAGSGFISGFSSFSRRSTFDMSLPMQIIPFGPSSYLSAQTRVVEDHTMSQVILQAVADGGGTGLLLVVTGASHVEYGSRGTGLPARISRKFPKKNQVVVLLDPERQYLRREGETPVADFLWYSAARPCSRNCFDRAEIARVMNAAGRRRDALPPDIQNGLDLGLVSPEVLQNLFDLEQYPLISELTQRFQGFRERLLADPKFLNRLAIEEAISITTTLIAQYEKRKENFFEEIDYVITDTVRGSVVDFFTVWLPAPTLSFLSYADETAGPDSIEALRSLLGSIPDNAFQKSLAGREWNLNLRIASVVVGGLKLAGVGVVSSFAAVGASNALNAVRNLIKPELVVAQKPKRSPLLKTAMVYGGFLGTSANLRYQIIAGLIEHRLSDELSSQPLLVNTISFVVRTLNSYFGTQQWIDLARTTGLQTQKSIPASKEIPEALEEPTVESDTTTEEESIDKLNNQ